METGKPFHQQQVQMISAAIEKINHLSIICKSFIVCGLNVDHDEQFPENSVLSNFNHRLKCSIM